MSDAGTVDSDLQQVEDLTEEKADSEKAASEVEEELEGEQPEVPEEAASITLEDSKASLEEAKVEEPPAAVVEENEIKSAKESQGKEKEAKQEAKEVADDQKKKEEVPEPDRAALKEQFSSYSQFGDKTADGKTITLSQSDKWFKQAKVIDGKKITTTDTGIAFRKISKKSPRLSFNDWLKYLEEISTNKKLPVNEIKNKLVDCGKPGLSKATSVAKNAAVDRLTDASKYGGTHKQRFDASGKGKGKDGRVDPKSDGYVKGYKNKGTYQK